MHFAATVNDARSLSMLIKGGSDLDSREIEAGWTAMMCAADAGSWACAKLLLDSGADPHARDKDGDDALLRALGCRGVEDQGLLDFVAAAIAAKVDVDAVDSFGRTPLMCAAVNNFEGAAAMLLEAGCDIEAKDEEGCAAVHVANSNRIVEMIMAYKERRALDKGVLPSRVGSKSARV